jgi:hypothetical protein
MGHVQHPARPAAALTRGLVIALVLVGSLARADGTDVATAQVLFDDARALMKSGDYPAACPKLEESERLAAAVGTEFNLADCYEHAGRLASAWARFLQVASATKARGQTEREQLARDRAHALEPLLGRLAIFVEGPAKIDGLAVTRDGSVVDEPLWGVAVPVDAGDHTLRASAPGHAAWETRVRSTDGQTMRVNVEPLAVAPPAPPPPATTTVPATPPTSTAPPLKTSIPTSNTQQTAGWITLGGAGVLGILGLVGVLEHNSAVSAYNADPTCPAIDAPSRSAACSDRVSTASTWSGVSVFGFVAGGAALGTAIVLLVTAPRSAPAPVTIGCAPGLAGVSCFGSF